MKRRAFNWPGLVLFCGIAWVVPTTCTAQLNYVARFTMPKKSFLLGEPIFCEFTIENTGSQPFAFSFRSPSRVLNRELETEPRFQITDEAGHAIADPAPRPCGGAAGSVVYGSASVPPRQAHTERWLLNEWGRFASPGRYRVRTERRLPLLQLDPATRKMAERPAAYALAINDLEFEVVPSTKEQLNAAFQHDLDMLDDRRASDLSEAILVLTTLPQESFESKLEAMAEAPSSEQRWDHKHPLDGLARLGTRSAWESILRVAQSSSGADSVRSYAILLLAEKGDAAFVPELLKTLETGPSGIRGDILRGLGFFRDPRANRALFGALDSKSSADRMNAILGLRNLESREAIPALLAKLSDPERQVRQVANFALQSLTGQSFKLSSKASREESGKTAEQWHAWWREKGATAAIIRQPPCHDW